MTDVTWPVVLFDGGDMSMYASYSGLNGYIEAVDVDDGVYEAFDSTGLPLDLSTYAGPKAYMRQTLVQVRDGVPPEIEALEKRLRDCVRLSTRPRAGMPNFETDPLPELIVGLMPWYQIR
jgi:hypothetical protein